MPTTYTHDVFGKMVYQKMPENLKEIAANHINSYRIGQHGWTGHPFLLSSVSCKSGQSDGDRDA